MGAKHSFATGLMASKGSALHAPFFISNLAGRTLHPGLDGWGTLAKFTYLVVRRDAGIRSFNQALHMSKERVTPALSSSSVIPSVPLLPLSSAATFKNSSRCQHA